MMNKEIVFFFLFSAFWSTPGITSENIFDSKKLFHKKITKNSFYEKSMHTSFELEEDYKSLAIFHALNKNLKKSAEYVEKYIKKRCSTDILNNDAITQVSDSDEFAYLLKKYKPKIDIWILFFFSIGVIGLFSSILILTRNKSDFSSSLCISLFVFIHSFFLIHLCLFLSKYNFKIPHSLYASTSFSFLYGPLIYFYFKRVVEKYRFKTVDLFHLLPSLFLFVYLIPIYLKSEHEKLFLLYNRDEILHTLLEIIVFLKIISLVIYGYLIIKIYNKKPKNFRMIIDREKVLFIQFKKWQKNLITLYMLYVIFYILYAISLVNIVIDNILLYPQIFSMCVIILYIATITYVQPDFLTKKILFYQFKLKYLNSGLTDSFSMELKNQLISLFENDKVYRESNLSLDDVAEKLGTTRHNISQVINEHFGMSFFNFINKHRIDEAIRILNNDIHRNYNMIDVAYDIGYNNKVTFNKAFKNFIHMTPTEYVKKKSKSYSKV